MLAGPGCPRRSEVLAEEQVPGRQGQVTVQGSLAASGISRAAAAFWTGGAVAAAGSCHRDLGMVASGCGSGALRPWAGH